MKKKIILLLPIILIFFGFNNVASSQRNYDSLIVLLVQTLKNKKNANSELLLQCIPTSVNEYLRFINLDYSKDPEDNQIFSEINELWLKACIDMNLKILHRYFEYSQFVDGYFADDYYDNIEKIFNSHNSRYLCKELNNCLPKKIIRLKEYLKDKKICE